MGGEGNGWGVFVEGREGLKGEDGKSGKVKYPSKISFG